MRALLYAAIVASPSLTDVIPADRWIAGGSVDELPDRPFAVIRITDAPPSVSKSTQPRVGIWVHDNRGSYSRIDAVLGSLRTVLAAIVDVQDANNRISCIEWTGDSPDLIDTDYNTNVRTASFVVTGRK